MSRKLTIGRIAVVIVAIVIIVIAAAIYSNPTVQACVNSFTTTSNVSQIQSLCTSAQKQIYNDAPYARLGVNKLWYVDGSLVWQKNVVKSFNVDQGVERPGSGPYVQHRDVRLVATGTFL